MTSDPLDDLLRSTEAWKCADEEVPEELAQRVWRIHRERSKRRTRIKFSAATVGGYLAGLVTMMLFLGTNQHDTITHPTVQSSHFATGKLDANADKEDPPTSPRLEMTANHVVRPQTVYARYCALGDEYLERGTAIEAATECYGLALDRATENEMRISTVEDSWLLIALKKERRGDA